MQEFKYNVFGNIRPSKVKTSISDDVDNPYLGKFMVRFCDGETAICSYKFPTDDDIENDNWVPLWVKDSTGEEIEATDGDLWYPMDYIFCMLSGFPTPYSCWEFGCALAHYRYKWKCGNTLKVRPTVNTWFIEHKDFFDDINEALSCFKRNRISVDKKELMSEMLKSHGLEVEYNMNTMVRVWESITSTF